MQTILFACVHNAGRSQMARAWFDHLADPTLARALSAGTRPAANVQPNVVAVMAEVGIDVAGFVPQKLTPELCEGVSRLVTMGCGDECPNVPGMIIEDWPLPDPKGRDLADVRATRDAIRDRVASWLATHGLARNTR